MRKSGTTTSTFPKRNTDPTTLYRVARWTALVAPPQQLTTNHCNHKKRKAKGHERVRMRFTAYSEKNKTRRGEDQPVEVPEWFKFALGFLILRNDVFLSVLRHAASTRIQCRHVVRKVSCTRFGLLNRSNGVQIVGVYVWRSAVFRIGDAAIRALPFRSSIRLLPHIAAFRTHIHYVPLDNSDVGNIIHPISEPNWGHR